MATGLAVVAGYAWWATGTQPFTPRADVAVAIPAVAFLLVAMIRFVGPNDPRTAADSEGSADASAPPPPAPQRLLSAPPPPAAPQRLWPAASPWLVLLGIAIVLEIVGLALGGDSSAIPTLSAVVDQALRSHAGRAALFLGWATVGLWPARRVIRQPTGAGGSGR